MCRIQQCLSVSLRTKWKGVLTFHKDSYVSQIQYIYINACRDNHTTKVSCLERYHAFIIITKKRMQAINFWCWFLITYIASHNFLVVLCGTRYHMSMTYLSFRKLWEALRMYTMKFSTSNWKLSKFFFIATSFYGERPMSCNYFVMLSVKEARNRFGQGWPRWPRWQQPS